MRLALSPLLCVLSASLVLAACGGSDGGGSNPTNVALDESAVTTMEEGLTYELVPDGGATVGNSVQSWRWSAQPIVEGALSQCAAVEQFDLERAATSLETACTVPGKCTLTFDQVSSPDVQGSGQSRFSVRIPVLKADVGVTYRLEAVDTTGQTSVGNFTFCLLAVNERPTAGDDAFTVTEGTPLVVSGDSGINLLTNDTDDIYVGNQPLSVTSTPVVAPTVATSFALQPDGGFSYLYEGDAVVAGGTQIRDSFQYEISDGTFNAIAAVNLTIVAVDNPPQLTGDLPDLNVVAGVPVEVDYSGFFADPEQGDLFFTAIGLPASGQLTLSPLGVLTGMATQADVGSYQVQIQADDQQNSAVGLFNLVVAGNQPPITQPIPDQVVAFGELVSIETADYFTDPEGVALTFALESQPPSDLQINPDTGLISGLITNPGQYQLTVVVDDAAGNLVSLSFQLTQQERPNQAPVFTGQISSQTVTVGSGINPVSGEFSDPDNDTLTYSINNTATGLSFNPVTGVLSGEPADLGITSFVITAEDPEGLSVSSNPFQITVTAIPNGAPVFSGNISNQTGRVGELITPISGNFSDPDDDALTFTSTTLPPGLILNAAGVINGTPSAPGTSDVTITATDTEGASVSSNEFSIIILPPIDNPPVITGTQPASISVQAGDNVGFQVNVTDEDESSLGYTAVSVNPAVATVAGGTNGAFTVNGISEGSTSVTITVTDGAGQSGSTSISVTVSALPNEPPEITGRLPAGNLTLDPGDEQTFSITVDDEDPSSLVYSSSVTNTLVATVATNANDTFTVTAVGEGQATVTFQIEDDGNLTDSVSFTVTVTALPDDPPVIDSRTPPGSISMEPGDSTVVTLDVTDEDEASLAYDADSDDTDVVTVSVNPDNSITFNAVGDGSTTVTLTVTDGAGQQDSVVVPVIVDTGNLAPVIDSRIPAGNSTLEPGDTLDVSLNVSDESFATLVFDADSDDTDVATVSVGSGGDFTVLAIADGVAIITFSVEDEEGLTDTDTMTITVDTGNQAPQITNTDPGTSIGLLDGEVETVTLTVTDEDLPSVI
ncbi:MAG: putative Ig domain-containing protein, partial [Gammaproteobacteria bacterium]|nr:putative Ig domain-containing protein [Gammaproteobacteria bacterium]